MVLAGARKANAGSAIPGHGRGAAPVQDLMSRT